MERVEHVVLATDPFRRQQRLSLSEDGRHALSQVQLDVPLDQLDDATVAEIEEAARSLPGSSDLEVHLGGTIFTSTTVHASLTEALGVVVALVVLAVTFGSLLAAGMPIVTAVLGVGVAMAGILAAASVTDISSSTPTLALMIGLAVGIDYALFIVSRHRSQLVEGLDAEESAAQAMATAGSAVIFAGTTVVIALCGLVVARIPFLAVMGVAAAVAVAVAVLVALTAVPAMLGLAGERLRPRPGSRAARHALVEHGDTHTLGARWVALVTRVPALTVLVVTAGLLVMALPAKDLALGLPDTGTAPPGSTERVTYDLVAEAYGPGFNTPLLVTVDIIRTTDPIGVMDDLGRDLATLDGVEAVALSTPNRKADLGIVQVVPEAAQADPATAELAQEIRDRAGALEQRYGVTDLTVTGHTAVSIDVSARLAAALLPFGIVVVGLSLVLLAIVFRSVAVPVKATLGYLLSVGASFGAVAAVFEWGWLADELNVARVGPVISFLPIILMGVLFGLAMDYEVFLVSRMREEFVRTGDARRAVTSGFTASARVVTAAAVIMISVFAAFVPHGDAAVKPIALGLAVGVFVDAFLVRMTLVPAVLAMLGDRAWWLPGVAGPPAARARRRGGRPGAAPRARRVDARARGRRGPGGGPAGRGHRRLGRPGRGGRRRTPGGAGRGARRGPGRPPRAARRGRRPAGRVVRDAGRARPRAAGGGGRRTTPGPAARALPPARRARGARWAPPERRPGARRGRRRGLLRQRRRARPEVAGTAPADRARGRRPGRRHAPPGRRRRRGRTPGHRGHPDDLDPYR